VDSNNCGFLWVQLFCFCLVFCINPENPCFNSRSGLKVKPLGVYAFRPRRVARNKTLTRREEVWPSGRNEKKSIWKVRRSEPTITKMLSENLGNLEIAPMWKLVVWASGAWWRWKKFEHLRQTEGQDSTYSLTSATARFGGATACYSPLRLHSDFWGGVRQMADPLCSSVNLKIAFLWVSH